MRSMTINNNNGNQGLISGLLNTYVGQILPQMLMDNYAQRGAQKIYDQAQAQQNMTNMDKANGFMQQMVNARKLMATDPNKAAANMAQAQAGLAGFGYTGMDGDITDEQISSMQSNLASDHNSMSDYLNNNKGTVAKKTWKSTPTWNRNMTPKPQGVK